MADPIQEAIDKTLGTLPAEPNAPSMLDQLLAAQKLLAEARVFMKNQQIDIAHWKNVAQTWQDAYGQGMDHLAGARKASIYLAGITALLGAIAGFVAGVTFF